MLHRYSLRAEAIEQVRRELALGWDYAHGLLSLQLEKGAVEAWLPSGLREDEVHNFDFNLTDLAQGNPAGEIYERTAEYLCEYLSRRKQGYAITELLDDADSPRLRKLHHNYFNHKGRAYAFLPSNGATADSCRSFLVLGRHYPFVIGLAAAPWLLLRIRPCSTLNDAQMRRLARHTDHILIGAYDADGFLIWSRDKPRTS